MSIDYFNALNQIGTDSYQLLEEHASQNTALSWNLIRGYSNRSSHLNVLVVSGVNKSPIQVVV